MTLSKHLLTLSLVVALGAWAQRPAQAVELTIYLNQATETGVREVAMGWEKATGNKVNVVFPPGAQLNERIVSGAPGDLFSSGLAAVDDYVKSGKIVDVVEYGLVGNGAAVKEGAPKYDISTPEKFKQALLEAKSIGHTAAGTGPFNTRMFQKMGIYDQIKDKVKIINGKLVAQAVLDGDVEFGIQQTNVIQPMKGTVYLGPLPDELMEYGKVGVGLLAVSTHKDEARAFMKYMADPANGALLRKGAMYPLAH